MNGGSNRYIKNTYYTIKECILNLLKGLDCLLGIWEFLFQLVRSKENVAIFLPNLLFLKKGEVVAQLYP